MISRALALLLLLWVLGFAAFAIFLPKPASAEATDAIAVVTGGPGRIARGLQLLEAHRAARMLISGVDRRVKPHEVAIEFRAPPGLVECCVDLGHESVDTRTNAAEIAAWTRAHNYRSLRLVTTDWHMRRARFELSRELSGTRIVADAVASAPDLSVLLKEYNKYLLRRLAAPLGL